jgi:hypothetical protein
MKDLKQIDEKLNAIEAIIKGIKADVAKLKELEPEKLISEAKRRGFAPGRKFKSYVGDIRTASGDFKYVPGWLSDEDCLSIGTDVIWRTKKGWATVLPSKKKLPKTKEEFNTFCDELLSANGQGLFIDVADYLKSKYDFND